MSCQKSYSPPDTCAFSFGCHPFFSSSDPSLPSCFQSQSPHGTMSRATSSGDIGPSEPFRSQIGYEDKDTDPGAKNSTTVSSTISDSRFAKIRNNGLLQRCWAIVSWTPSGCRWDPENPPKFSIALNLLFAFVSWP
jgi:hypothetical protein